MHRGTRGSTGTSTKDWWPEQLDVSILKRNQISVTDAQAIEYAKKFSKVDLAALQEDLHKLMTDSQDCKIDTSSYLAT
jgi:catalase-peroxidase